MDDDGWWCRTGLASWAMRDLCPWPDGLAPPVLERPLVGPGHAAGQLADGMPVFRGGVWHEDANALTLARHFESARCILTPAPPRDLRPAERLKGTWLYAGALRGQFGHFVTESLARLWALDLPELGRIDGLVWSGLGDLGIPGFAGPILDHMQALPPVRFVTEGTVRPDRLVVPRQEGGSGVGLFLSGALASGLRRRFASQNTRPAPGREKVYVSRSRMRSDPNWMQHGSGKLLPGPAVDAAFRKAGYHLFHPETARIAEQIETYRRADVLVLDEGSALHLAGLVAKPQAQVVLLCRRPQYRMLFESHLRILLGREARLTVRMVDGEARQHAHGISLMPDPQRFAELFISAGLPPVIL